MAMVRVGNCDQTMIMILDLDLGLMVASSYFCRYINSDVIKDFVFKAKDSGSRSRPRTQKVKDKTKDITQPLPQHTVTPTLLFNLSYPFI